jgi:hypothetical protein
VLINATCCPQLMSLGVEWFDVRTQTQIGAAIGGVGQLTLDMLHHSFFDDGGGGGGGGDESTGIPPPLSEGSSYADAEPGQQPQEVLAIRGSLHASYACTGSLHAEEEARRRAGTLTVDVRLLGMYIRNDSDDEASLLIELLALRAAPSVTVCAD